MNDWKVVGMILHPLTETVYKLSTMPLNPSYQEAHLRPQDPRAPLHTFVLNPSPTQHPPTTLYPTLSTHY